MFSGFLQAVRTGVTPRSGIACSVATVGDRPAVALVLALTCLAAMAVAMPMTRGLSQADGPRLAVVVAAVTGLVALAGVLLLLFVLGLALAAFAAVVDRGQQLTGCAVGIELVRRRQPLERHSQGRRPPQLTDRGAGQDVVTA